MISININNSFLTYGSCFIIIALLKLLVTKFLYKKYLRLKGVALNSQNIENKQALSLYKFLYYISALITGAFVLYNEDFVFDMMKIRKPLNLIPFKFKLYYIYEIAFYSVEILTIFYEPRKKDFYQMIIHHFSTIALMLISFNRFNIKYGLVILILHDSSDPILEFSKLHNRMKNTITSTISFTIFAISFVILRLYIYPRYILFSVVGFYSSKGADFGGYMIMLLLFALQVMHIIWTKFILLVFLKAFKGEKLSDSREKEE